MRDDEGVSLTTKSDHYLYAILDTSGRCWVVRDGATEKVAGLPSLMREGRQPIRETPFVPAAGSEYILICLENAMHARPR
jgi:hypothetical protein